MRTMKTLSLVPFLLVANVMLLAQSTHNPKEEVRNVISRFEVALQTHDIQGIEALVSPRHRCLREWAPERWLAGFSRPPLASRIQGVEHAI
jgi:hypothetical protein